MMSPDQYYKNSPLLFWTVVSVVARRYQDEPSLLAALSTSVTRLLWGAISTRPHNRYMVESILLQLAWPFPMNSMWIDNSYVLSGIARQAALQLGLHRPENAQDYSRTKIALSDYEIQQRTKTWAVCNILAQRYGLSDYLCYLIILKV